METTTILQWQYLIFVLPAGIAAALLLLSALHLGHHVGHGHAHAHAGPAPATGHTAHAPAAAHGHGTARAPQTHPGGHDARTPVARSHHTTKAAPQRESDRANGRENERPNVAVTTNFVLHLTGADRAPLIMVLEAFCLVWGLSGYLANMTLLHAANPTLRQFLPSLSIALCAGLIGARIGAELLARAMPKEESLDVSRDGLFGLTGNIAFPVSATSGRIHVYDRFGTLHDEMCRVVQDHPPIQKGHRAMVVDIDRQGLLLVEEVPETIL